LFLMASFGCVLGCDSVYMHIVGALCMAVFWHQSAWIGHDTCHNSIVKSRRVSHLIGIIYGNLMTGVSAGWWKYTHNMHHVTTNEWDKDPDVIHLPFIAVTEKMFLDARARKLTWTERRILQIMIPLQHILYFPIMVVARVNLYIQSIYFVVFGRIHSMPMQRMKFSAGIMRLELIGIVGYWIWFSLFLWYSFERWQSAAVFVIVSHVYMGILHMQITLSHWERPFALPDESDHEWMRVQASTARNIESGWFNDWYFGGLHYQIEHHLFPRVPRHNLGKLKVLVKPFCDRWSIVYCSSSFLEAIQEVVFSLNGVGRQLVFDRE